ncbi:MAG: transposase [Hungatella sp.]|uniref:transposase n=1 Tax=Hungatella TaxID=1649459 RepID=UPI0036F38A0D
MWRLRSARRKNYRSGHYKRNFQTTAGEVKFNVPKLKRGLLKQPSLGSGAAGNPPKKKP